LTKQKVKKQSLTVSAISSEHEAAEARYRALFEYAPDGILIADAESYYLDANPSICNMLGYTRDELIGMHAADIIVQSEFEYIQSAIDSIKAKENYIREWQLKRKDGTVFSAEIIATTMPDGKLLGMVRDITLLKEQQREIAQLSRLYAALTKVNQAIIWLPNQEQLFSSLCRILVEEGGFKMAWVGWNDPVTNQLVPAAVCGDDNNYLSTIKVYSDDRPEGRGPSGIAFRSGQPYICNNMQQDAATLAWREEINSRGFRASAAFPIRANSKVCGTISVYAEQALFFQDKEIALLKETVDNISFALENLAREERRRQAEILAKNESLFSDMMIESMPGILYFYNYEGKFLRWNHNFQTVSGYSNEEIANMHPLDFFAAEEKSAIAEKITEVFTQGQSFIEASLLAKDGARTSYLFTGRNVKFQDIDCLVGMGIDISERKNAESKLVKVNRSIANL
jgi:PAS domain S-box-containing protein